MNPAGQEFTEERLVEVLGTQKGAPVAATLAKVTKEVRGFAGAAPQSDDITCLVVRYNGTD